MPQKNVPLNLLSRYRIKIISIVTGLFFCIIILNVWFTIKSNFDESIAQKVEVAAQRIISQVSEVQLTTLNVQDLRNLLDEELADFSEFYIEIFNPQGLSIYTMGDITESLDRFEKELFFRYQVDGNKSWMLRIRTTSTFFENSNYRFIYVGLFIAMSMSILLGIAVYFGQKSRQNSKKLRVINAELETAKEKAEQASISKTKFLANMSHEIRTPMNVIMGFISILKSDDINKEQREYLHLMEVSSKNLLSIVNDILDIEKLESGEVQLNNVSFNPILELEKMKKMQKAFFEEKGLFLNTIFKGEKNNFVDGDPNKFHQIFTNLIRNAFKFTDEGGLNIHAYVSEKEDFVLYKIEIADTGIGIPDQKLREIFERFNQIDSSPNRKYEGTGLGLAITKKLVEAMGGKIEVVSKVGEGTTFTLNFSFYKSSRAVKESDVEVHPTQNIIFPNSRVLIIDDQFVNILVIEKTLQHFGIESDYKENALDGIKLASDNDYDLILMDIHMPGMDGFEATAKLKAIGIKTPIVGLSADVTPLSKKKAFEKGMQDYLTKPFERDKLLLVLKKYLLQEVSD